MTLDWCLLRRTNAYVTAKSVADASILTIERMESDEAHELLARWALESADAAALPEAAAAVARGVDYHPLALAMAGAVVRGSVSPDTAWQDLQQALTAGDIGALSHQVDDYPVRQLQLVFEAAQKGLDVELRQAFPIWLCSLSNRRWRSDAVHAVGASRGSNYPPACPRARKPVASPTDRERALHAAQSAATVAPRFDRRLG